MKLPILFKFHSCILRGAMLSPDLINCQFSGEQPIRESPPQVENRIMAWVYVRRIRRSTMYQKAPFC